MRAAKLWHPRGQIAKKPGTVGNRAVTSSNKNRDSGDTLLPCLHFSPESVKQRLTPWNAKRPHTPKGEPAMPAITENRAQSSKPKSARVLKAKPAEQTRASVAPRRASLPPRASVAPPALITALVRPSLAPRPARRHAPVA